MAAHIVDRLQPVYVENGDSECLAPLPSPLNLALQSVIERAVVEEPRHGVEVGLSPEARVELRPEASLAAAREWAGPRGVVIVAGSLYLLGDIREVALS